MLRNNKMIMILRKKKMHNIKIQFLLFSNQKIMNLWIY
jgi:hypothetical protein